MIAASVLFIAIIITTIVSSLYINYSITKIDNHLDIAIENIGTNVKEVENHIKLSIDEYNKSHTVYMMFVEKDLCKSLISELKTAEFNLIQSHDEMTESIYKTKIILEQIKINQSFTLQEIV